MANMLCIQDKVLLDVLDSHEHVRASVSARRILHRRRAATCCRRPNCIAGGSMLAPWWL